MLKQIAGTAKGVASAGSDMLGRNAGLSFDSRPPISAAGSGGAPAAAAPITINVYGAPGQDANAIAQAVAQALAIQQSAQQARQRGRLADQE